MKKPIFRAVLPGLLVLLTAALVSCAGSDYKTFSLREGIGHFSMEYPARYMVSRIDIRNELTSQYSDIGLIVPRETAGAGLNEISVWAWPVDAGETGASVLETMLDQAGTVFKDYNLLERFSIMVGDMDGQGAVFSWTAEATGDAPKADPLPAVSRIVIFRQGELAWEIHVAADEQARSRAEVDFQHVVDTFTILN